MLRLACFAFAFAATACAAALNLSTGLAPTPVAVGVAGAAPAVAPAPAIGVHTDITIRVSFFGIPLDDAQDVVFVLDRSGSMSGVAAGFSGQQVGMSETTSTLVGLGSQLANGAGGHHMKTKLDAAKEELIRTLRAMPDGTRFNLIFFDDSIAALSTHMMVLDPGARAGVEAFVRGIKPGGSTAAVPALDLAYGIGAARVVLLSDGLPNTGGGSRTLLANARTQIQHGVRFDTVGLGIDQDSSLLQTLARESGGLSTTR